MIVGKRFTKTSLLLVSVVLLALVSVKEVRANTFDVFVYVDMAVWNMSEVRPLLNQYLSDIAGDGFSVLNATIDVRNQNVSCEDIKNSLHTFWNMYSIKGAVLIGNFPFPKWTGESNYCYTDYFYMDLNGTWTKNVTTGAYYSLTGHIKPEIWVGRITAYGVDGDEEELYVSYFTKNHQYRNANSRFPITQSRALAYVDNEFAVICNISEPDPVKATLNYWPSVNYTISALSRIYDNVVLGPSRLITALDTNPVDYMNRCESVGYDWVWLVAHSNGGGGHGLDHFWWNSLLSHWETSVYHNGEGEVPYSYYLNGSAKVFFYTFNTCFSGLNISFSGPRRCLANAAVFGKGLCLASVGLNGVVVAVSKYWNESFDLLKQHECLGEAYKRIFDSEIDDGFLYGLNRLVFLGDPTIRMDIRPDTPPQPTGPTSGNTRAQYLYYAKTTDPNGDMIRYQFDWGDNTNSTTTWYASGTNASICHAWSVAGIYAVKVRAQDYNYLIWSDWSQNITVTITQHSGGGGGGQQN